MSLQANKLKEVLSENAIGFEEFAFCLGIEPGFAEQLCQGKRKLTNTLARQIEQTFSKPKNWLDVDGDTEGPNYDLFG